MYLTMNRGIEYCVDQSLLSDTAATFFMKSFGCTRKVYNEYVDILNERLEKTGYTGGSPVSKDVIKMPEVSELKKKYDYLKEVDSLALANAKLDFQNAIEQYNTKNDHVSYTKRALRRDKSGTEPLSFRGLKGMPKFKSKAKGDFAYKTNCQYPASSNNLKQPTIRLEGNQLYLPKLKEPVPLIIHRHMPKTAKIKNVTVRKEADGRFYVSICYEYIRNVTQKLEHAALSEDLSFIESLRFLGLDYSQQHFYVDSEGRKANCPHAYRKSEEKLAKLQKRLSKMQKGSRNYLETLGKIQKLHKKIANQRKNFCHVESRRIADAYDVVVVEDIDLRAMGSCLHLGKNLHDNGFGMFRSFLKYKLEDKGSTLVKIDRWTPSTKRCSDCGYVNPDIDLKTRYWVCPVCGEAHDRDENAAVNIREEGVRIFVEFMNEYLEDKKKTSEKSAMRKTKRKSSRKQTVHPLPEAV